MKSVINKSITSFISNNLLVFLVVVILVGSSALVINADSKLTTTVSISPASQTVNPSDTFNVNVNCVPGQPIRAFQFSLSFNPSFIQCNSGVTVTESHTWNNKGDYAIKVKAIDENGTESSWATLEVSMPKNRAINPFLLLLERLMERFPMLERILLLPIFNGLLDF